MFSNQQSSNPVLNAKIFRESNTGSTVMSVNGVMNRSLIFLGITFLSAAYAWTNLAPGLMTTVVPVIAALIVYFITASSPHLASITGPIYCVLEGIFLGVVSSFFEMQFPGIVVNSIVLTFGVTFFMLMSYKNGYIKATPMLAKIVGAGFFAIILLSIASLILPMLGFGLLTPLHQGGVIGIGYSLFIVGLTAFSLILDFDQIESSVNSGAPKNLEWWCAFGLMITLIYLYLNILILLMKIYSSDD